MTRRDYVLLSELQKEAYSLGLVSEKAFGRYCSLIADRLQTTNPAFDRHRFLVACGVFEGASK